MASPCTTRRGILPRFCRRLLRSRRYLCDVVIQHCCIGRIVQWTTSSPDSDQVRFLVSVRYQSIQQMVLHLSTMSLSSWKSQDRIHRHNNTAERVFTSCHANLVTMLLSLVSPISSCLAIISVIISKCATVCPVSKRHVSEATRWHQSPSHQHLRSYNTFNRP